MAQKIEHECGLLIGRSEALAYAQLENLPRQEWKLVGADRNPRITIMTNKQISPPPAADINWAIESGQDCDRQVLNPQWLKFELAYRMPKRAKTARHTSSIGEFSRPDSHVCDMEP